ncbi:MAG: Mut7-C RNAse domain-containing protein [Fervidicoccaceae archaeon]
MVQNSRVKFGVDAMLGNLARYLRILGYDTLYWKEYTDAEILEELSKNDRILITRDKQLYFKAIDKGINVVFFTEPLPINKLLSCLREVGLIDLSFDPKKSRCPECNGELMETNKPPMSYGNHARKYFVCKRCGMIYWVGKHFHYIMKTLGEAKNESC